MAEKHSSSSKSSSSRGTADREDNNNTGRRGNLANLWAQRPNAMWIVVQTVLVWWAWAFSRGHTTRLEVTARSNLNCGDGDHAITSGLVHLPQGSMFFSLFEGKGAAKHAGVVVQFEGGPGASAFDYPFLGAGPCQLTREGDLELSPAPYPWTDHANLLVVDFPLATGWSYNTSTQVPANTSALAAEDFDDFLQAFYKTYPQYIPQPLIISTLSYGGTTGSHIASTVLKRNNAAGRWSRRVVKKVDELMFGNPFADAMTEIVINWDNLCKVDPPAYNTTVCTHWRDNLNTCVNHLRYISDVETSTELRIATRDACVQSPEITWEAPVYSRYDRRAARCYPPYLCHWWWIPLRKFMNLETTRELLGTPAHIEWDFIGNATKYFFQTADNMQSAYKLLEPVLQDGTRLMAYSGMDDTICSWEGTYNWMKRLPSPHLATFRAANLTTLPSNSLITGNIVSAGDSYTLVGVEYAGHIVEEYQPQFVQAVVEAAVAGRNWSPVV
ncbi:hypothetical protein IAT38_007064 [Cryptococcus sp. DSM 104549]